MATPVKHHSKAQPAQQQNVQTTVQQQPEPISNTALIAGGVIDCVLLAALWIIGKRFNWVLGIVGTLSVLFGGWLASRVPAVIAGGAVFVAIGLFLGLIAFIRWVAAMLGRSAGRGFAQGWRAARTTKTAI